MPDPMPFSRVLGELGHRKDNRRSRQAYERHMEEQAKMFRETRRDELEEKWKTLRRGWYMGDETFRSRLLELMEKTLKGKRRESYLGDELREHDEAQALRILQRGLDILGISEGELQAKPKGSMEKQVLAWWLKKKTVVSRKWISEKLRMCDLSRVTNSVRKVDLGKENEIRKWKMQLEKNS
jgi:hypothetical protein